MSGVDVHVYRDGDAVMLNIVDENSSILVTFETEKDFEDFKKKINEKIQP